MSKPSIAELLRASGHTVFTADLVGRAVNTLYGYIGAGLDERDWDAILASNNPLAASETALVTMYSDQDFLLRNANHLSANYGAAQIEYTYRQTAERLGSTHSSDWAVGTRYELAAELDGPSLKSRARQDYEQRREDNGDGNNGGAGVITITAQNANLTTDPNTLQNATAVTTAGEDTIETQFTFLTGTTINGGGGTDTLEVTDGGTFTLNNITNVEILDLTGANNPSTVTQMGNDFTRIDLSAQGDTITATARQDLDINGGAGADTVIYTAFADLFNPTLNPSFIRALLHGGAGTDTIRVDDAINSDNGLNFNRATSFERLVQNDTAAADITITNAADLEEINISASTDASTIDVSAVNTGVTIRGGDNPGGDDTITGSSGGDEIIGGAGDDELDGRNGDDDLRGNAGDDVIVGGRGDDTLDGGFGDDTLTGGAGADVIDGGAGADTASYATSPGGVTVDLTDNANNAGADALGDQLNSIVNLIGSDHDDTLTGNIFNNRIDGGDGDDSLDGNAGDDTLNGGAGVDRFNVDSGTDTISDLEGSDVLVVSPGATANATVTADFTATAATENDGGTASLTAADDVDIDLSNATVNTAPDDGYTISAADNTAASALTGSAGDDIIAGGDAADTLTGRAGDDQFLYTRFTDFVTANAVVDQIDGGAGGNRVSIADAAGFTLAAGDLGNRMSLVQTIDLGDTPIDATGAYSITLDNNDLSSAIAAVDLSQDTDTEHTNVVDLGAVTARGFEITGGANADEITGTTQDDVISGGGGVDILKGGDGDDTFVFNDDSDLFNGSNRINGVINGGMGWDSLRVSANGDPFEVTALDSWAFSKEDTTGLIRGVQEMRAVSSDSAISIVLNDDAWEAGLNAVDLSGDTDADGLNRIDVSRESDAGNQFNLTGSAGKDDIRGGAGTDSLLGGAGDDTMMGGAGADTLDGDTGSDLYVFDAGDSVDGNADRLEGFDAGDRFLLTGTLSDDVNEDLDLSNNPASTSVADGDPIVFANDADFEIENETGGTVTLGQANVQLGDTATAFSVNNDGNVTGGDFADHIVGGAGSNRLAGGGGEDRLTGGGGADDFIQLNQVVNSVIDADVITDFDTTENDKVGNWSHTDIYQYDFVNLIKVGANLNVGTTEAIKTTTVSAPFSAAGGIMGVSNPNFLLLDNNLADTDAVESALEAGGANAMTVNGTVGPNDGFFIGYDDGVDSYLGLAIARERVESGTRPDAGDLEVVNLVTLLGLADVTDLGDGNFLNFTA
ncbi:beta strand repeat-containing protein [Spiribacter insolitus]|uniref:Calcium-binding protein n=1 Tax=Spiribacter insolitus TaxID=3122417 RepID=A0ABV3T7D6_9GAMM